MLEAMACGTPVAAYPVTGPIDVVRDGISGCLDEDLGAAVRRALKLLRADCRDAALERTWDKATGEFMSHLARVDGAGALFGEALLT
jgi:glycosyltransferase involved in cell wall biosynthesis